MPYIDMRNPSETFEMVQTVQNNFEEYTKKQVEKSILDRKFQVMIGHPTKDKFKQIVIFNLLTNFPVGFNAHTIFSPQRSGIWGGTVIKNRSRVDT